eukprot:1828635-Amphidinium_carterae.1
MVLTLEAPATHHYPKDSAERNTCDKTPRPQRIKTGGAKRYETERLSCSLPKHLRMGGPPHGEPLALRPKGKR